MKFPKEMFLGILSVIRTKLLNIIIYEDNSVRIGDGNKLKNNIFQKLGGKNNGN